ncbi:DUF397 domain-containing protein [Streptomyces sp. SID3212]|uniref:DUF397 domain-containing protein n=1 Tax=unclassified Streptomyces TaxID=2593676 RepID=UPI00136DC255|nr:DUF397 domain-containing protein [Streptomyces sp. SID3212]
MTGFAPGTHWIKSSYSGGNNNCVEVAHRFRDAVPVRDSKRPSGPALAVAAPAWTAFLSGLKTGGLA